jgi:hypothetical protein
MRAITTASYLAVHDKIVQNYLVRRLLVRPDIGAAQARRPRHLAPVAVMMSSSFSIL